MIRAAGRGRAGPPPARAADYDAGMARVTLVVLVVVAALAPAPARAASPVLLVPGFMGWRDIETVGPYFQGLREALEDAGADVYAMAPPPIASSEARGAAVGRAIDDVLLRTHADKVAIIAHSQGGLDVRVALASGWADKVAVVVTLATPHHGTDLADAAAAWMPRVLVEAALARVQATWEYEQHQRHRAADVAGALADLSRAGSARFNERYPGTGGVPFFSVASVSGGDVDGACVHGGKWGEPAGVDSLHPLFLPAHLLIRARGGEESDDGVVPTNSMRFGTFLGCVPGDHVDWMGWSLGDSDAGDSVRFDDLGFLVELWRGMRDVEEQGDAGAMDAHVPALARLAHAVPVERRPAGGAARREQRRLAQGADAGPAGTVSGVVTSPMGSWKAR